MKYCISVVSLVFTCLTLAAQEDTGRTVKKDTLLLKDRFQFTDTIGKAIDSILFPQFQDTIKPFEGFIDTVKKKQASVGIESKVDYESKDSLRFNIESQKVFLYKDVDINYEDINLKSGYVDINFKRSLVYAEGLEDTAGVMRGMPVFAQGGQEFQAKSMKYNFITKKGLINDVVTQEGEGYIHGTTIKKMPNDEVNISKGSYTTCPPCENKDYEFRYFKSKVIPGKQIVTGPAYLVVEDVPTPLFIPFGIFPNRANKRSGLVIPSWGESADRGFYFEEGGYYWAINDYIDLRLVGDIYTGGSWAIKPSSRYKKRYKFSGNFDFLYAINILGEKYTPSYQRNRDYSIRWLHQQDAKARPKGKFSADVNVRSSKANYFNPTSAQDYLSNTFQSSISYQTNFANKYFLTINANQSQSTIDNMMDFTLPNVNFTVSRFYPLRRKEQTGKRRWYENISIDYNLSAKNTFSVPDSMLFTSDVLDNMVNGIQHNLPINSSVKLLKHLTWTNSINLRDRMYFESIQKYWVDTVFTGTDTIPGYVETDTLNGFKNAFDYDYRTSVNTRLYGIVQMGKKSPLRAIRHVFTPTVGFSFQPSFGGSGWGYWDSYYNPVLDEEIEYSIFQGSLYGTPSNKSATRLNFSLANNLEIKIRNRRDTITGTKKIPLIDNFSISGSYNFSADSLNLSRIRMSGLWKGFDIMYSSTWDPYALSQDGTHNVDKFEWNVNKRLLRQVNSAWNFSLNLALNPNTFKKPEDKKKEFDEPEEATADEIDNIKQNIEDYINWNIPWNLNVSYTFAVTQTYGYVNNVKVKTEKLVQTLALRGDVNVTPKWKIGFLTGWDFENAEVSYTSLNIYRDLHCFEMRFNWIPIGPRKSWNFALNIKANILQDAKLEKKRDFRDLY